MKAKLKFDLDNFEDRMAFKRCVKSEDMALVLWEILHNSRKTIENFEHTEEDGYYDGIDAVYKRLWELMEEHNLNIDNLIE
jgi:hypothetical protein